MEMLFPNMHKSDSIHISLKQIFFLFYIPVSLKIFDK